MRNRVPAVRYTKARRLSMRTLSSSAGVSWRTLMGYPSYARNYACALPSPSPFHYVMATIVPMVKLAAHAKSGTLYGQSYGRTSKFFFQLDLEFFRVDVFYFALLWGYASRAASSANILKKAPWLVTYLDFTLYVWHMW